MNAIKRILINTKKNIIKTGISCGILLGTTVATFALTTLFCSKTATVIVPKNTIFNFNLNIGASVPDVFMPGDSFPIYPSISNDANKNMYVFIKIDMPVCNGNKPLYYFDIRDGWSLIEDNAGSEVYAYCEEEMTVLHPGEITGPLTSEMNMKKISAAEYAVMDSLDFTITGYAIGTEDVSTDPSEAWITCCELGNVP